MPQSRFTRRDLARYFSLLSAGGALPFSGESALAQLSMVRDAPADAVMINANENPLGPCPEAVEAVLGMAPKGGRYFYYLSGKLEETLAAQEKLPADSVAAAPGSSLPLHHAVLAFTSSSRPLVVADPGYEAGEWAARVAGAPVLKVPLRKDYAHDVRAMAAVSPSAGLIYLCNPNNPTGTLTPRADIEWLVANKPAGSVVMIDEAYLHISGAESSAAMVAAGKDVIILRTFSKIYGMAGLRAGAAMARPDLLKKIGAYMIGGLPTTAMAAAIASLNSPNVVPERRKVIAAVRQDVFEFLDKYGFHYVPSVSNKFMVDVRRPGREMIQAMARENVYIGRVWPAWPTYVRVTVGTPAEMEKFKTAFLKVTA